MVEQGYKYRLEPYNGQKTRFTCPNCGKKRNFARYIDTDGNYVGDEYGRCNSENSCGYHKPPSDNTKVVGGFVPQYREPTFLRYEDISLSQFNDHLYRYLVGLYREEDVRSVYAKYIVRESSRKWNNSTVFYQRDSKGRYRTGKIILYDPSNGKRVKEPYSHIYWVHNFIDEFEFVLEQCLFGEHLLKNFDASEGSIYLVESEKTALICMLEFPDSLFLATGGMSNLNEKKLSVLRDYDVEAIPDKGGYEFWKKKLQPLGITVNTVMEDADEAEQGDDIADLILMNK